VVVEGSYDGGASWVPFEDGYDASADATWLKTFNNYTNGTFLGSDGKTYTTSDSKGVGLATMYKKRTIKMLNSGDFVGGDVILIRFRLFADELTYGWGWAIDNLQIQVPPPPPILATEQNSEKVANQFSQIHPPDRGKNHSQLIKAWSCTNGSYQFKWRKNNAERIFNGY